VRRYDEQGQKQPFVPKPKKWVLIRETLNEQHESEERKPTSSNGDDWLIEIKEEGNGE
jgi:hypothetical protein